MKNKEAKIAVCVSGGGRSLKNLVTKQVPGIWRVAATVSSSTTCAANQIAFNENLPIFIGDFDKTRLTLTSAKLSDFFASNDIDWIVLAGFLKNFPILRGFNDRVINIHPALLPKYGGPGMYGHHVHEAVILAREPVSGATVHFVNERYDEGKIISQIKLPIATSETSATLANKIFASECVLLPETISGLVAGRLPLSECRIWEASLNE
ncbi:MAG: formyltransferase family protein [Proteobacteria bacterium]|nr:formyltransferase family protein [Pseudomonadota bacterium]